MLFVSIPASTGQNISFSASPSPLYLLENIYVPLYCQDAAFGNKSRPEITNS